MQPRSDSRTACLFKRTPSHFHRNISQVNHWFNADIHLNPLDLLLNTYRYGTGWKHIIIVTADVVLRSIMIFGSWLMTHDVLVDSSICVYIVFSLQLTGDDYLDICWFADVFISPDALTGQRQWLWLQQPFHRTRSWTQVVNKSCQ